MSYLMDYGDDWPPRPPRRRMSLLRWLNDGKRRRRPGFDRYVIINVLLIVAVGAVCAVVLKATDRPPRQFVVNHSPPAAHATPDVSARSRDR